MQSAFQPTVTSAPASTNSSSTPIATILPFSELSAAYELSPLKSVDSGRATPYPLGQLPDNDSGYGGDDDCDLRPINWGSVLSLSSQSALDPLTGNDLYTPTTTSAVVSAATATLVSTASAVSSAAAAATASSASTLISSPITSPTLTTMTTAPSFVTVTSTVTPATNWEYNLLDMDLGLGPELTELLPSWKLTPLSADDILKSVPPPMEPSRILMDADMDQLTHIMVGS